VSVTNNCCLIFVVSLDKQDWVNNFDYFIQNVNLVQNLNRTQNYDLKAYFVNGSLSDTQQNKLDTLGISTIILQNDLVSLIDELDHPSQQHGMILNIVVRNLISTYDHLILMDPDYYIVQNNWIDFCINIMSDNIDLFGAGYPYWMSNYRNDYPTAYFMVIKSGIVNKFLDFSPETSSFDFIKKDMRVQLQDKFQHNFFDYWISNFILKKSPELVSFNQLSIFIKLLINFRLFFYRRFKSSYVRDTGYKLGLLKHNGKVKSFTIPSLVPLEFDEEVVLGVQPKYYLFSNPDVQVAGMDPVIHFWKYGITENRKFQIADIKMEKNSILFKMIARLFSFPMRSQSIVYWSKSDVEKFDKVLNAEEKYRISFWYLNNAVFSFHLGNVMASRWSRNLNRLECLISALISVEGLEVNGKA
jgi:hypothetical protein